jgi:hypothetical protein
MATKMANATLPTDTQIHDAVVGIIAGFAKKDTSKINDGDELTTDLRIPDESMGFLTLSLRAYIKHFRKDRTIGVAEVRKPKQTVAGIITIVTSRLKQ